MPTATEVITTETSSGSYEERCERRYRARAGVKVNVQAPPDILTEEAVVSDISFRGIGVLMEEYVEPGTRFIVHMGTQRLDTEVRHCTREEQRYRAGLIVRRAFDKSKSGRDWDSLLTGNRRQAPVA